VQPQGQWIRKAGGFAGAISLVLGTVVLAGWCWGVARIVQPVRPLPGMVPNTAVWFVLLGSSLLLLRSRHLRSPGLWLARAFVLAVIFFGGATLAEHLFHLDLGVDQIAMRVPLDAGTGFPPGRSAPGTAAAFVLLGMALLMIDFRPALRITLPEILASGAALIALLAVAGYVYGATSLYRLTAVPHTGMAPHTTLGLLLLSAGVMCLRPDRALIELLSSSRVGGLVVRRLLIGASAIPVLGLLVMMGQRWSLYERSFAEALIAVAAMAVAVGLALATGRTLDRLDVARTASERAVTENEERLRHLIEQASDGIFIANLDGRYTEVNDAGCEMLGYRREDLIGKTIMDLIPASDVPRLRETKDAMLGGAATVDEWMLQRSDGTYLPVEVSAKILPDGRWQGLVRDISARKDVERAGQAMAEALTGAPESSVHVVLRTIAREARLAAGADYVALGLAGDKSQPFEPWVFVGISSKRAAAIGRAPRPVGLLGLPLAQDRTVRVADIGRDPAFGGFPPHHPAMTSLLGVPIRSRGRTVGVIYLANKRGAAEFSAVDERAVEQLAARAGAIIEPAQLYQQEGLERAWLQATIDQMPEGVILADANGMIHAENQSIQVFAHETGLVDVFGKPERYDLRLPNGEQVPAGDRPRIRALVDGVTTRRTEFLLRHPDGRMVPMLVSAAPVFDLEGHRSGAVAIYQDISTLKELERLREEWSSIVAHDLRQPLGVITVDAEMLATLLHAGDVQRCPKVIDRIRRSTRRLNTMINDLLDVSRIEARHLALNARHGSAAWLDDSLDRLSRLAPANPLRLRTLVRPAQVFVDPARIEQVLGNLISNAAKYGQSQAEITIELAQHDAEF
jgi:PAS domain S-box-containing protein